MKYRKSICSQDSFERYHKVHRFSEGFGIEGVGAEDVGGSSQFCGSQHANNF